MKRDLATQTAVAQPLAVFDRVIVLHVAVEVHELVNLDREALADSQRQ
jgi:hypothetical protein